MKLREMMDILAAIREAQSAAPSDTAPMWSWPMAKTARAMEPHMTDFREAMATGVDAKRIDSITNLRATIIRSLAECNPDGSPRVVDGVYVLKDPVGAAEIIERGLSERYPDAIAVLTEHNAKAEMLLDQDVDVTPEKIDLKLWPKLAPTLFDRLFVMVKG